MIDGHKYSAGDKIICWDCGIHAATIAREVYQGEVMTADMFEDQPKPWHYNGYVACDKCATPLIRYGQMKVEL